jgi:hypothetical protein
LFRIENDPLSFLEDLTVSDSGMRVAFFQVAFDSSGTFDRHPIVSYGGAVATLKQWSAFTEPWNEILQREELRYFKMAEAMKWYGEFVRKYHDWGNERESRRNALLNRLVDLAERYEIRSTGAWLDTRSVNQEKSHTDKKMEALQGAVLTLLKSVPEGEHLALLFDEEMDIEPKVQRWVRHMRQRSEPKMGRIAAVCFVDDRLFPVVQLADMIAWLFREHGERVLASGDKDVPKVPLLEKLMHASHFDIQKRERGALLNELRQYEDPPSE